MAETKIIPQQSIVVADLTSTTNYFGAWFAGSGYEHYVVIGAKCTTRSVRLVPYYSTGYGTGYVILDAENATPIASTSVTLRVALLKID